MIALEGETQCLLAVQKKLLRKHLGCKRTRRIDDSCLARFQIDADDDEAKQRRNDYLESVLQASRSAIASQDTSEEAMDMRELGPSFGQRKKKAVELSIKEAERRLQTMLDSQEKTPMGEHDDEKAPTNTRRPRRLLIKRSPQKKKDLITSELEGSPQKKKELVTSTSAIVVEDLCSSAPIPTEDPVPNEVLEATPAKRPKRRLTIKRSPQKKNHLPGSTSDVPMLELSSRTSTDVVEVIEVI